MNGQIQLTGSKVSQEILGGEVGTSFEKCANEIGDQLNSVKGVQGANVSVGVKNMAQAVANKLPEMEK